MTSVEPWPLARSSASRYAVFVAHSDGATRNALEALILAEGWQPRIHADSQTLLAHLQWNAPACVILDTQCPMHALALQSLLADGSDLPVIFIADNPDARTIVRAMKAGAIELLTLPIDEALLREAIRHALQLSASRRIRAAQRRALLENYARLSPREREVMRFVVRGTLNKNIAIHLGITEITVKAHRGRVMRKMQAATLPDLVNMAAMLPGQRRADSFSTPAGLFTGRSSRLSSRSQHFIEDPS